MKDNDILRDVRQAATPRQAELLKILGVKHPDLWTKAKAGAVIGNLKRQERDAKELIHGKGE